ncbi:MAG: cytochrome C [Burkholderiaceae bacterium]
MRARNSLLAACLVLALPSHAASFEDTLAQRLLACTGCHGENGRAVGTVYFPRIAGKPAGYLLNQLRNFRDGRRNYGLMTGMVEYLSDDYLQEIAQHFSALDLPYPAPQAAKLDGAQQAQAYRLVTQGDSGRSIAACTTCHGSALTGFAPHVPGLLGLPRDYINAQLGAWKTGQRRAHAPDCMADIARALTTKEVALVSGWLAAQALPPDSHAVMRLPARSDSARRPVCGSAPELAGGRP